jgi:hypothetical protein
MAKTCTKCGAPGPFYKKHSQCVSCVLAYQRARYAVDPKHRARARATTRAWKYGVTLEQFDQLFENQEGLCGICSRLMQKRGDRPFVACVDHDHVTGKVRGLLCGFCNVGLGHFKDSPTILRNAVGYVGGASCPTSP